MSVLSDIQRQLFVPKGQYNDFGGFSYRSAEDILKAVKPLLPEGYHVTTSCSMMHIGNWNYVHCRAELRNASECWYADGIAREQEAKKGMDAAQITGAVMSYAKKYALGNLFAIDNERDPDAMVPESGKDDEPKKAASRDWGKLATAAALMAVCEQMDEGEAKRRLMDELKAAYPKGDFSQAELDEFAQSVIDGYSKED